MMLCEEKKRFDKTNQEVIQQNILLHGQFRALQKKYQEGAHELIDLRRQLHQVELENERMKLELTFLKA